MSDYGRESNVLGYVAWLFISLFVIGVLAFILDAPEVREWLQTLTSK